MPLLISEEDHALLIRRDRLQRHPLHFAAGLGMSQSIKEIIEVFPDAIHDKDIDGWTPLHWVCRGKSSLVIKFLLDKGARADARTNRGWRPIDVAKYHGARLLSVPSIAELLNLGHDSSLGYGSGDGDDTLGEEEEERLPPKKEVVAHSNTPRASEYSCASCLCVRPILYDPLVFFF